MQSVVNELRQIVAEYTEKFNAIPDDAMASRPQPGKWSKKEVIGHLIDSAQNNIRRFVCGQYESAPPKIVYNQDFWVAATGYQQFSKKDVIQLWSLLNLQLASILANMPAANYQKQAETSQLHSLQWLAEDYVFHLKHHINQVIAGSFNVVYK